MRALRAATWFSLAFVLTTESSARAQTKAQSPPTPGIASLFVRVTEHHRPLPSGSVVVLELKLGALIDEHGNATVERIPTGLRKVRWSMIGYEPVVRTITFTAGRQETLLVADPNPAPVAKEPGLPPVKGAPLSKLGHDPRHRVGVVFTKGDTCFLAAATDSIPPGAVIHTMFMDSTGDIFQLRVAERVARPGRTLDAVTIEDASSLTLYRLQWMGSDPMEGIGLGVVQPRGMLQGKDRQVTGDLDDDGANEMATTCAGQEGINFFIRSQTDHRLRWHGYYHLGFDIEPTCTDADVAPE